MGEVGHVASRSLEIGAVLVEEEVQLVDQRPHLVRLRPADPLCPARTDEDERVAQSAERAQPQPDL